jgi:hypothetical protein
LLVALSAPVVQLSGCTSTDGRGDAVQVEPPREFAFRRARHPGVAVEDGEPTLVEFSLSPVDGGTLLRLVESGFRDETHLKENSGGWDSELAQLVGFVEPAER